MTTCQLCGAELHEGDAVWLNDAPSIYCQPPSSGDYTKHVPVVTS